MWDKLASEVYQTWGAAGIIMLVLGWVSVKLFQKWDAERSARLLDKAADLDRERAKNVEMAKRVDEVAALVHTLEIEVSQNGLGPRKEKP